MKLREMGRSVTKNFPSVIGLISFDDNFFLDQSEPAVFRYLDEDTEKNKRSHVHWPQNLMNTTLLMSAGYRAS